MSDINNGIYTSKDLEKIFDELIKDRVEAYRSLNTMFLTPKLQEQYNNLISNLTKKMIKEEKKELTKEDLLKLPLNKRYVINQSTNREYNKTKFYITTPGIINEYTREDEIILSFYRKGFLGCCGSTVIGDMKFYREELIEDKKSDKEFIMNLMLSKIHTNNCIMTDTLGLDEENYMSELFEIAQPEVKPVDSYFNENSGNTVIIYSYNKKK